MIVNTIHLKMQAYWNTQVKLLRRIEKSKYPLLFTFKRSNTKNKRSNNNNNLNNKCKKKFKN